MISPHAVTGRVSLPLPSLREAIGGRLARLSAWAPLVYLLTALPTVVFLTTLTPPFQAPDEPNHFRRAAQLLGGEIVGRHRPGPGDSGAILPKSVSQVADSFMYIPGHPENKYSADVMAEAAAVRWNRSDKGYVGFPNIVIYPPLFYLPSVAALAFARAQDWGVLASYRLARSVNGVVAVLAAAAAIGIMHRGRSLLFVLLSLPMSLTLFASVSQDALLVPGAALAVALCSRAAERPEARTWPGRLIAAVLLGATMAGRPPYVFLLLPLAMTPPRRASSPLAALADRAWPVALALAIGVGWIVFGAAPAQVEMRIESGVSIAGQMREIVLHPSLFPSALWRTLSSDFLREIREAIGVLGWSDGPLPTSYHLAGGAALAVGALLATGGRFPARRWGIALGFAMAAAFVAAHGALYLSWTPVGSGAIEGFQGRYILPIAFLAALAVPALTARSRDAPDAAGGRAALPRSLGWAALFAFALASDLWLPFAVFDRYFA